MNLPTPATHGPSRGRRATAGNVAGSILPKPRQRFRQQGVASRGQGLRPTIANRALRIEKARTLLARGSRNEEFHSYPSFFFFVVSTSIR